ncbi:hypothetical protein tb265_49510 [Gemmatimonadetes bacterium T265]|nr:hypothetical protein tb265_49510 [Gemmatimonadetes bacterium T265]
MPAGYAAFFAEVAARVRAAHLKAVAAVNRELITLYWDLGREIVQRQQREGWGAGVVARLAADLRREFPGARGFSERNVRSARAFYLAYAGDATATPEVPPAGAIRQQPVAETGAASGGPPDPVAALPWGHNLLLLEKLADPALRRWYAGQAVANGWSRNVLALQVESRLHARVGRADQTTNFAATLPPPQSDLAREVVKDPYNFEFLAVAQGAHERHVEAGLIAHMREFLLELGTGFLYAGSQYRLVVGGDEFFLDLLFYHKRLRCWVVLDLKTGEFRPEYAGKMHFYLNVVDDQLRDAGDQPSIGLILCRSKNAVVAEYALRGVASPVGVAEYRVTDATEALPAELRAALPSLEAVRAELEAAPLVDGDPPNVEDVPPGA